MLILSMLGGAMVIVGIILMVHKPSIDRTVTGELVLWYSPVGQPGVRLYKVLSE